MEAAKQAPTPTQPAAAQSSAIQSPKYCAVCTPLEKLCPNEYPITGDWQNNHEEGEERQDHVKDDDNFSMCSDWDADWEEQDQNNLKEDNNDNKTPQPSPKHTYFSTIQTPHQLV